MAGWVIVGTRPEVIKQVPVYWALKEELGEGEVQLVGTGQHRELLNQALEHFSETLSFNLDIMTPGQTLSSLSATILQTMGKELAEKKPSFVVVQGDTSTAAITAMAAFFERIPVFHNEGGLRSYDLHHPFPEEANRKWIGCVADMHFPPTEKARQALLAEGVTSKKMRVVGNPGIDSLMWTLKKPVESALVEQIREKKAQGLKPVLITSHRRENSGEFMNTWYKSLREFADKHKDLLFVCPLHPNKIAGEAANAHLGDYEQAILCEPINYSETCHTLKECHFVVTDSGGIQEEAATLGVPAVVCRRVTERMEAIEAGLSRLSDPGDAVSIIENMQWAYELANQFAKDGERSTPYPFGKGDSGPQIAKVIAEWLKAQG